MFISKFVFRIGGMFIAVLMLLILFGCSNNTIPSDKSESSASEVAPNPAPTPTQSGTNEVFNYNGLSLEVTNVDSIHQKTYSDDMESWETDVFVVYPGATVTVLSADMNEASLYEDKIARPKWGFLTSSYNRIEIVDGMEPMEITPDLLCVYNLEASTSILDFEMYDESNTD